MSLATPDGGGTHCVSPCSGIGPHPSSLGSLSLSQGVLHSLCVGKTVDTMWNRIMYTKNPSYRFIRLCSSLSVRCL